MQICAKMVNIKRKMKKKEDISTKGSDFYRYIHGFFKINPEEEDEND